jgi:hypothetical protein
MLNFKTPINGFQKKIIQDCYVWKRNFPAHQQLQICMLYAELQENPSMLVSESDNKLINKLCSLLGDAKQGKLPTTRGECKFPKHEPYSELDFQQRVDRYYSRYRPANTSVHCGKDIAANQGEEN